MPFPWRRAAALLVCLTAAACSSPGAREYQLTGQVLAVDPGRQEITIKHEDIPAFMPGMTMAFKVREPDLLDGRAPGDLVRATLVVEKADAHLRDIARIGFEPVAAEDRPAVRMREPGEAVEDAAFLNDRGEPRRLADWRGRVLAVTFVYTRCPVPNFCPLMDRHFKAVQDQVRSDPALNGAVRLASVTVDPAYDTPVVLARHAAVRGADGGIWEFLQPVEDGEDFAAQFGISTFRSSPQEVEVMHNLRTAVIDGEGRLVTILNGNEWTPADLVATLHRARAAR